LLDAQPDLEMPDVLSFTVLGDGSGTGSLEKNNDIYGDSSFSGNTVSGFTPVETAGEINRVNSFTNVS